MITTLISLWTPSSRSRPHVNSETRRVAVGRARRRQRRGGGKRQAAPAADPGGSAGLCRRCLLLHRPCPTPGPTPQQQEAERAKAAKAAQEEALKQRADEARARMKENLNKALKDVKVEEIDAFAVEEDQRCQDPRGVRNGGRA